MRRYNWPIGVNFENWCKRKLHFKKMTYNFFKKRKYVVILFLYFKVWYLNP